MSKETLKTRFEKIEHVTKQSDSHIVEAVLRSETEPGYRVQLSLDAFIGLIGKVKPRIVYAFSNTFSARDGLLAELLPDADDDDEEGEEDEDGDSAPSEKQLLADSKVAPVLKRFASYDGQVESFLASFVVDGVIHSVYEQEQWGLEFDEAVDELKTLLRVERRTRNDADYEVQRTQMRQHAATLCAHPKFSEGRPSKEKREYLAQSLFPKLDDRLVSRIVDEATNMLWLNSK